MANPAKTGDAKLQGLLHRIVEWQPVAFFVLSRALPYSVYDSALRFQAILFVFGNETRRSVQK